MKKLLIGLAITLAATLPANATKVPDNIQEYILLTYPKSVFRFDGVIQLPNGTVYLPLIPSKFNTEEAVDIKYTIPENKAMTDEPDVVVLSNDYVLLKLIKNDKGKNTVIDIPAPPVELVTGLLPQDLLVPKNFVLPASMKNIVGNLDIKTEAERGLIIPLTPPKSAIVENSLEVVPALQDKMMYVASYLSKNIQVVDPANNYASYALSRDEVPITVKGYDLYLLVTSFGKKSVDVISLQDDKVIKQIEFKTQPEEIVIDNKNKLAYISSGEDACLYVINLETMTIKRQIRINGMCEKITLSEDGTKLFYNDKETRVIWSIELDNNYLLKEVGKFPNVSKIAYVNDKIYLTSRTKNRLAIVDYETLNLLSESPISEKPLDMLVHDGKLLILCAGSNAIDILDSELDQVVRRIELSGNQFPTKFTQVDDSNIVLVTDAKSNEYSVLDLDTLEIVTTNRLDIPVNALYITNKIQKIGDK